MKVRTSPPTMSAPPLDSSRANVKGKRDQPGLASKGCTRRCRWPACADAGAWKGRQGCRVQSVTLLAPLLGELGQSACEVVALIIKTNPCSSRASALGRRDQPADDPKNRRGAAGHGLWPGPVRKGICTAILNSQFSIWGSTPQIPVYQ